MSLRKAALGVVVSLVALNVLFWALMRLAPEVPDPYEGVHAAAPTAVPSTPTTTPPPLPAGFPSMELPPPKIEVAEGEPQPIATKFGLTYDIPPGWDNWYDGVAGWNGLDGTSATYGAVGFYQRSECTKGEYEELAMTGMTGRRGAELDTLDALDSLASAEVAKANMIFSNEDETVHPTVRVSGPMRFTIDGRPAVRYSADVDDIPPSDRCTSPSATFDVVTTEGYATAEFVVFVVITDQGVPDALREDDIDQLIASIRRS